VHKRPCRVLKNIFLRSLYWATFMF
jgi:hypothetical protein